MPNIRSFLYVACRTCKKKRGKTPNTSGYDMYQVETEKRRVLFELKRQK